MRILCKKYSQYFIAILMITVLHGKSVICVTYETLASKYASTTDAGESSSQDSENETENPLKTCKKSCPDMESGLFMVSVDPLSIINDAGHNSAYHSRLAVLYQKVPTQPPLRIG